MGLTSSVPNSILQPGVCTSSTRPASPYHGQVVFETDTQKTLFYNGTSWVILNDPNAVSIDSSGNVTFDNDVTVSGGATVSGDLDVTGNVTSANQGLVFIKSQAIGSGVSSVTVTDAFSSTFDNYKVIVNNPDASSNQNLLVQVDAKTTGYYGSGTRTQTTSTTVYVYNTVNGSNWYAGELSTLANSWHEMEFLNPYHPTRIAGFRSTGYGNGYALIGFTGVIEAGAATSQYSSFTLFPASGTLTGGTIRVYGYAQ